MEKLYRSKTFLKVAGGRIHTPHPTLESAPGHKLHKTLKESGIFQSLSRKGGGGCMAQCPPSQTRFWSIPPQVYYFSLKIGNKQRRRSLV